MHVPLSAHAPPARPRRGPRASSRTANPSGPGLKPRSKASYLENLFAGREREPLGRPSLRNDGGVSGRSTQVRGTISRESDVRTQPTFPKRGPFEMCELRACPTVLHGWQGKCGSHTRPK